MVRGETAGRWSYVGASEFNRWSRSSGGAEFVCTVGPAKVFRSGAGYDIQGDPLVPLERELDNYKFIHVQGAPPFTGKLLFLAGEVQLC